MAAHPVCKMQVNEEKATASVFKGGTYHFCCTGCKTAFDLGPEKFLGTSYGRRSISS
jgi:YHS domain-containing protein